jgi:hypothetical protein
VALPGGWRLGWLAGWDDPGRRSSESYAVTARRRSLSLPLCRRHGGIPNGLPQFDAHHLRHALPVNVQVRTSPEAWHRLGGRVGDTRNHRMRVPDGRHEPQQSHWARVA